MELETNGAISASVQVTKQSNIIEKYISPRAQAQKSSENMSSSAEQSTPAAKDRVTVDASPVSVTALDTLKSLDSLQKKSNELAQDIRATSKNINTVTDFVSQMQSSLSSITKNFPPFNIESEERQQILMSYISIRQQLLKMTIPQPPPPLFENISNIWKKSIGKDGALTPEAVPVLQTNSSDSDVQLAEKDLQGTRENLATLTKAVNEYRPE